MPDRPNSTGTRLKLDLAEHAPTVPSDSGLSPETHARDAAPEPLAPPDDALGGRSQAQPPEPVFKSSPAAFVRDSEQLQDSKLAQMSNEDRTIALLWKTPHLTVAEVATMVDVNPKSPCHWKRFLQIHQSIQTHLHAFIQHHAAWDEGRGDWQADGL